MNYTKNPAHSNFPLRKRLLEKKNKRRENCDMSDIMAKNNEFDDVREKLIWGTLPFKFSFAHKLTHWMPQLKPLSKSQRGTSNHINSSSAIDLKNAQ